MTGRFTPEQTLKSLWTRLAGVALSEKVTIAELAKRSDRELMRTPNLGRLSIAALRERYPSPDGAGKPMPKPKVIQIAVLLSNCLVVLRDDGTIWEMQTPTKWQRVVLPEEGE